MATINYRLNSLSPDDQTALQTALGQFFPHQVDSILQGIEQNGAIPDQYMAGLSPDQLKGLNTQVNPLLAKLPTSRTDAIQQYLKGIPNTPEALTDDQLQNRIQALQDLNTSGMSPTTRNQRTLELTQVIGKALQGKDANGNNFQYDPNAGSIARQVADAVISGGQDLRTALQKFYADKPNRPDSPTQLRYDAITGSLPKPMSAYTNPNEGADVSQELGNLQGISNLRQKKATQEKGVTDFLGTLPGAYDSAYNDLEKSMNASQGDFFSRYVEPSIAGGLNARGILDSGDYGSSLAEAGGNLQRQVRDTIAPLRAGAISDVTNKSFENILRGALQSGQDLNSAIGYTRDLFSQNLQNQFTAGENALNRSNQQSLANQQTALMLALNSKKSQPSGLDYFLQYGLPAVTSVATSTGTPWWLA